MKTQGGSHAKESFKPYLDKMESSDLKVYIEHRVLDQIMWYSKKSRENQECFRCFSILAIFLNAAIPIIVLFSDFSVFAKCLVAGLSSFAGAVNAVIALCRYQELWVQYRSNCEALKSVLYRFFLKTGEFKQIADDEAALMDMLVSRCEEYFMKEFQTWGNVVSEKH